MGWWGEKICVIYVFERLIQRYMREREGCLDDEMNLNTRRHHAPLLKFLS